MKHDLKKAGLKTTLPRLKILQLLETNADKRHVTAEDVYKILLASDSEIGLATIYRVLTQFEEAGIVKRHHFDGLQSIFELDDGEHHDHMVCIKCGTVKEFVNDAIEDLQNQVADGEDFQITDHSLYIYGFCKDCQ